MKMEVLIQTSSPQKEFGFDRASAAMYSSAPSSPKPFGDQFDYFYDHASAPTSPTRAAAIYAHFSETNENSNGDSDFAFDFNVQLEDGNATPGFVAADELFEAGKIRSLKPPPLLHDGRSSSPRSPKGKRGGEESSIASLMAEARDRGRERVPSDPLTRSRRASRSLSPLRGEGDFRRSSNSSPSTSIVSTTPKEGGGSKRWRLRDLLLFRSASEGRATGRGSKDLLRKYSVLSSNTSTSPSSLRKRPNMDDSKNGSFRSTTGRASKTGPAASAHEIHYAANRAASEEMKKKTPLPYHRHGLFGYLRFNPAVNSITRGFNSTLFSRNRA